MSATRLHGAFNEDADEDARAAVVTDVLAQGAATVRPLFPGNTGGRRRHMFVVDVPEAAADRALEALSGAAAVRYAEREPQRRPSD